MVSRYKAIKILVSVAAILAVVYGISIAYAFNEVGQVINESEHINTQLEVEKDNTEAMVQSKPEEVEKPAEQSVTVTATVPEPAVQTETKVEPQDGGHIPFTNEQVTPGVPESYVGTVGQCPFYEMAGEKGCVPPSDIECNADWSVCTYKGGEQ